MSADAALSGANAGPEALRSAFYRDLTALLHELHPENQGNDPDPDTHLWVAGYVDSLVMLEIVYFLEDRLGHDIELEGDFLPTLFTMESIFDTYIGPEGS